jgi:hypothetical protein
MKKTCGAGSIRCVCTNLHPRLMDFSSSVSRHERPRELPRHTLAGTPKILGDLLLLVDYM